MGRLLCCGEKSYSVLDQTKLCCSGVLHDLIGCSLEGAECVGTRIHCPQSETQCGSILHPQRGLHCCGEQTYDPDKDLCCAGHRWPGKRGMGCCGVQPYDPGDPKTKCCSGHLHSLQAGHHGKAQCCGVHLIANVSLQCCASAQKQLPYPRTPGLSCCGHFQYNTTQHYCCAGHLRRVTPAVRHRENSGHCELITLDTQKALHELCKKTVLIGSVESMAVKENGSREVVVKNVLQIHVEKNLITLRGTHVLLLNHCSCPPLAKDGLYLFNLQETNRTTISDLSTTVSPVYDLLSTCQWAHLGNASTCS
ncbi:hypothetical protein ANANG_G00239200 [Anguilla anguilla]|uniref:Galaxin-like repeats domain-containing protein n=1 Tax=Anguilla anguilla TaxID=7936 RepID=A0A9D3RNW2_ANGAN|nr:hypothetical protein ANANG_G00239200 [Anguilla anguilla]